MPISLKVMILSFVTFALTIGLFRFLKITDFTIPKKMGMGLAALILISGITALVSFVILILRL